MTKNISNQEARKLIKTGATVVDIRDEKDFGVSHIPGAINISINDLDKLYLNKPKLACWIMAEHMQETAWVSIPS